MSASSAREGGAYEAPSVDDDAAGAEDLFAGRLGAVRLLLESRERDVATHDILLASAFEYLDTGPKTTDEVLARVRKDWPGVVLTHSTVANSLATAADGGFVTPDRDLGSAERWRLLDPGRRHVESARQWGRDVVTRTNAFLGDEARKHLGRPSTEEEVHAWGRVLRDALFDGIKHALTEKGGGVKIVDDSLLFPDRYELERIRRRIAANCHDKDVCAFLSLMAGAALDPSNPFGSELVHHIATGYILYAYVGRRDRAAARTSVGSLAGEVAILDTPMLLRMLGSHGTAAPVIDLVTQAMRTGVTVVVTDQTVSELERLLDSRERSVVADVEEALMHDSAEAIIRRADDQVVAAWLETPGGALNGRASWEQFRQAAKQLPQTLKAVGAVVGMDNEYELADSQYFFEFQRHLKDRVTIASVSGRGDWNIEHDARLLVAARQARTANPPSEDKVWPGSFIVTTDRKIGPVYDEVVGPQGFPVTLTPAQWAGVIASCSDPVSVEDLAQAMASETSHETLLARSANLPLLTALEIGRSLAGTGVTAVDAESVQLAFEDIVTERADLLGADPSQLAGEVLNRRHQSFEKVTAEQRGHYEKELRRTSKEREVIERVSHETATALRGDKDAEREKRVAAEEREERAKAKAQRIARAFGATIVGLLLVAAVVGAAVTDTLNGSYVVAGALTCVVYAGFAVEYCANLERPTWRFVLTAIVAAAALGIELVLG